MTAPYTPQPGTIPARVIAYMRVQAEAGPVWISLAELEAAVDQSGLSPYLSTPLKHGALKKRWRDGNRRIVEYAIGDGKPLPSPEDHETDEPIKPVSEPITPKPAAWPPAGKPTGEPMKKPRGKATGPAQYADIESMQITDDPVTARTASSGDKYSSLFAALKLGQCIKCRSEDAPKVGNALRKWRDTHHPGAEVKAVKHYPADSLGRVWLLAGAKAQVKRVA